MVGLFSLLASTDISRFTISVGSQRLADQVDKSTRAFDDTTSFGACVIDLSIKIESLITITSKIKSLLKRVAYSWPKLVDCVLGKFELVTNFSQATN